MKTKYQKIFNIFFDKYDKKSTATNLMIGLRYADNIDNLGKLKPMFSNISRTLLFDLILNWLEVNAEYEVGE